MIQHHDTLPSQLRWAQPHVFGRHYELRAADATIGSMDFRTACGSLAEVSLAGGTWTFKRVGFWQRRATVRAAGSEADSAVFEHDTWASGGTLTLAGGRTILVTSNFWQSKIEFQTPEGHVFLRYLTAGFIRSEATVEVLDAEGIVREMPWLLAFGWYLVVMMNQDSAATAVIVC